MSEYQRMVDETTPSEAFVVSDLSSATWAMRKLAAIRAKEAEAVAVAIAEIGRLEEWIQQEEARAQRSAEYFEGLLVHWHRQLLDEDPRAKTVNLPNGKLTARQQQPEYQRNDDELLEWAKATSPKLVITKESPNWAEIKQYGKVVGDQLFDPTTGEVIPGVLVLQREPKFAVQVNEKED